MLTDKETAERALRRSSEIKKRRDRTRAFAACFGTFAAACAAVLIFAVLAPQALGGRTPAQLPGGTATIFTELSAGGYVFVGLISFALGVAVALICIRLTRGKKG